MTNMSCGSRFVSVAPMSQYAVGPSTASPVFKSVSSPRIRAGNSKDPRKINIKKTGFANAGHCYITPAVTADITPIT